MAAVHKTATPQSAIGNTRLAERLRLAFTPATAPRPQQNIPPFSAMQPTMTARNLQLSLQAGYLIKEGSDELLLADALEKLQRQSGGCRSEA